MAREKGDFGRSKVSRRAWSENPTDFYQVADLNGELRTESPRDIKNTTREEDTPMSTPV
jgi:hypothetical protein|tara:strand:+ start:275 stop:451 length:177 start_codon:yes stop_codon:yes gene_type:complete